jgi:hypothetical protein
MKPRLVVEQKITAFVNKYAVYTAQADGSKGDMIAFAQQKRFNIREKFQFYTNQDKSQLAFTFRAEKVLDVHGRYFVEDADGKLLGMFRKDFKKSLLNSTWHVLDAQGNETMLVKESNAALAVLRRFLGLAPYVGDLADMVLLFFRYHFSFLVNGQEVGMYKKTKLLRDHYLLSMEDQAFAAQDIRVLAAQAVALDALQSR